MRVRCHFLVYDGLDSPQGKVYFAAWDEDDSWAMVGWGPDTKSGRVTQYQQKPRATVERKLLAKLRSGYQLTEEWVVEVDDLPRELPRAFARLREETT